MLQFLATQSAAASSPAFPGSQQRLAVALGRRERRRVAAAVPLNWIGGGGCNGIAGWYSVRSATSGTQQRDPEQERWSGHDPRRRASARAGASAA